MKIAFDADETWEMMSLVVARVADEAKLSAADKAKIRRWRSNEMKTGSEAVRSLAGKINEDLTQAIDRKKRSQVRKPDWR